VNLTEAFVNQSADVAFPHQNNPLPHFAGIGSNTEEKIEESSLRDWEFMKLKNAILSGKRIYAYDIGNKGKAGSNLGFDADKTEVTYISVVNENFSKPLCGLREEDAFEQFFKATRDKSSIGISFNGILHDNRILIERGAKKGYDFTYLNENTIDLRYILPIFPGRNRLVDYGRKANYQFCKSNFSKSHYIKLLERPIRGLTKKLTEDADLTWFLFQIILKKVQEQVERPINPILLCEPLKEKGEATI